MLLTEEAATLQNRLLASRRAVDILLCLTIGAATGVIVWTLFPSLSFTIANIDLWFDSDSNHVADAMVSRWSPYHGRNNLHPLFGLATYPIVFVSPRLLDMSEHQVIRTLTAASAAAWSSLLFVTLRLMKRPPALALLFTGIAMSSTSGLFFLPIVERYVLGSISMLACVAALAAYERRRIWGRWLVMAAAGTLGVTITNFMVGATALVLAFGVKRGLQATLFVVCAMAIISTAQAEVFLHSAAFGDFRNALRATGSVNAGTVSAKSTAFWFHSIVSPEPRDEGRNRTRVSVQKVSVAEHRLLGGTALLLWIFLLVTGMWTAYRKAPRGKVDLMLVLVVLGQFGLHMVFGREAIMYSLHFMPLMVLIASGAVRGVEMTERAWNAWSLLVAVFLGLLLWNNWQMFMIARNLAVS